MRRGAAGQVGERARAELRARGESLPLVAECGPRPSRPSESPIRVAHLNRPSESPIRVAYRVAHPSRPSESPIRVDPASCGPVAGSRRGVRLPPCLLDTRFAGISASFPRLVGAFSASFPRCSIFSASFRRLFSVFPASLQHLFRVFSEPFPRLFRVSSASFPRLFGAFPASCRRLFRAFSASFPRVRERPDFRAGPKAMSGCKAVSPPPHPPPLPCHGFSLGKGKGAQEGGSLAAGHARLGPSLAGRSRRAPLKGGSPSARGKARRFPPPAADARPCGAAPESRRRYSRRVGRAGEVLGAAAHASGSSIAAVNMRNHNIFAK